MKPDTSSPLPLVPDDTAAPARVILPTLLTWLALTLLVLAPLVTMFHPFAISVATGGILAVLCRPIYDRIRRRLPAWASGLTVTLGVLLLLVVPITLLLVGAFRQAASVLRTLSIDDAPTLPDLIVRLRERLPFLDTLGTPEEIHEAVRSALTALSQAASQWLLDGAQGIPRIVLNLVLVVLTTYFFLVDGPRLYRWLSGKVPISAHIRELLATGFEVATNAVVLASLAAAGAQALILLVAFWVLGVPAALLGAGLAFVLAWIPPVGPMPIWASAAFYLYTQGSPTRALIMVGVGVGVGVVDNVVRPLVLRGREEMHPMVGLLAILGGIASFGVPGVFIGPLLASMGVAVLNLWPAVAAWCGIPVSEGGGDVPDVPMVTVTPKNLVDETP